MKNITASTSNLIIFILYTINKPRSLKNVINGLQAREKKFLLRVEGVFFKPSHMSYSSKGGLQDFLIDVGIGLQLSKILLNGSNQNIDSGILRLQRETCISFNNFYFLTILFRFLNLCNKLKETRSMTVWNLEHHKFIF